jgi:glycerophosphoryl diester phosphodiesterase
LNGKKGASLLANIFNRLPSPHNGIIGHRGVAAQAPENTLLGFKKAAQYGLNWVEFDIQRCKSGEWVVFHDDTLDRTTNGHGLVIDTPYNLLKSLDAGSWFHSQFKNEHIPTLEETLSFLVELQLHPNIEIKVPPKPLTHAIDAIGDFLRVLQRVWPNNLPPPLVSSFDLKTLQILRSLDPRLPLGYLVDQLTQRTCDTILNLKPNRGFDAIHCDNQYFSPTLLAEITSKSIDLPILVYTVNNLNRIKALLQNGVTAVFSDLTDNVLL